MSTSTQPHAKPECQEYDERQKRTLKKILEVLDGSERKNVVVRVHWDRITFIGEGIGWSLSCGTLGQSGLISVEDAKVVARMVSGTQDPDPRAMRILTEYLEEEWAALRAADASREVDLKDTMSSAKPDGQDSEERLSRTIKKIKEALSGVERRSLSVRRIQGKWSLQIVIGVPGGSAHTSETYQIDIDGKSGLISVKDAIRVAKIASDCDQPDPRAMRILTEYLEEEWATFRLADVNREVEKYDAANPNGAYIPRCQSCGNQSNTTVCVPCRKALARTLANLDVALALFVKEEVSVFRIGNEGMSISVGDAVYRMWQSGGILSHENVKDLCALATVVPYDEGGLVAFGMMSNHLDAGARKAVAIRNETRRDMVSGVQGAAVATVRGGASGGGGGYVDESGTAKEDMGEASWPSCIDKDGNVSGDLLDTLYEFYERLREKCAADERPYPNVPRKNLFAKIVSGNPDVVIVGVQDGRGRHALTAIPWDKPSKSSILAKLGAELMEAGDLGNSLSNVYATMLSIFQDMFAPKDDSELWGSLSFFDLSVPEQARGNPFLQGEDERAFLVDTHVATSYYMNPMMTRTVRVRLDIPAEAEASLLDLQARVTAAYNDAASVAFNDPAIKGAVHLHHAVYYRLRSDHGLKSQFACNVMRLAMGSVATVRGRLKKGKKGSCPSSKILPIPFDVHTMTLRPDRMEVSLATMGKRLKVSVHKHFWLERYDGWDCDSGKLSRDNKGRWWLSLTLTKEVEAPKISGNVIGCDRGIVVPAALSNGKIIGEPHWHGVDRRYYRTQRGLQAKGTRSAKRRLKKRSGKWQRFRLWCDHNVSKHVLDTLPRGTTLVLEDLTNIRLRGTRFRVDTRRRMHAWSFRRQQDMMSYKAPEYGVEVAYVDARYTSQRCSKCGHTSRKNRPSRERFVCEKCKHTEHADLNAAKNIAANWSTSQQNGAPPVAVSPPYATDEKDARNPKVGRGSRVSRVAKGSDCKVTSPKPPTSGGGCLCD